MVILTDGPHVEFYEVFVGCSSLQVSVGHHVGGSEVFLAEYSRDPLCGLNEKQRY